MLSVISDAVLEAARELNERDAKLADPNNTENLPSDDEIWEKAGVKGLTGKEGQPITMGGSYHSTGPYAVGCMSSTLCGSQPL